MPIVIVKIKYLIWQHLIISCAVAHAFSVLNNLNYRRRHFNFLDLYTKLQLFIRLNSDNIIMVRTTKIYVGNLPENADNSELQGMFEKYGDVKECDIVKNYAFVHMSSEDEAKAAIDGLNNSDYMGSKISVEISHSKVRQRPGMGGKGQCYRCGRQGHWSKECPRNPAVRINNSLPPVGYPTPGYGDRFSRFGMDRSYGADRSFGEQRGFVERMRPYPDPYERRPPMPSSQQDNYMYYRRPYDGYGYTRRSPPPGPTMPSRYDFTQDPTFASGRLTPTTRRAPVF